MTGDGSQKRMKHNLLLERAGNNQIDAVPLNRAKNASCRIALFIMNSAVFRQRKPPQSGAESFSHFFCLIAHINQAQLRPKPITDAFSFGEHLIESRRERARDRDRAVRRGISHSLSIVSDAAI